MSATEKESMREVIKRLTTEYLSRGGVITICPITRVYPIPSMKWIADKGMDYSSWVQFDGLGSGYKLVESLGDGGYATKMAPFEGDDAR